MKMRITNIIYALQKVDRSIDLEGNNESLCKHHIAEAILYLTELLKTLELEFTNEVVSELSEFKESKSILDSLDKIQSDILDLTVLGHIIIKRKASRLCKFSYQSTVMARLWLTSDLNSMLPILKEEEKIIAPVQEVTPVQETIPVLPVLPVIDKPQEVSNIVEQPAVETPQVPQVPETPETISVPEPVINNIVETPIVEVPKIETPQTTIVQPVTETPTIEVIATPIIDESNNSGGEAPKEQQ